MKTTYKRVLDFNDFANRVFQNAQAELHAEQAKIADEKNAEQKKVLIVDTKEYKAIQQLAKRLTPILETYNDRIEDLRLEHANVDANGSLLFDEKGNYQFSKAGMKAFREAVKDYLTTETAEFEAFHLEPDERVTGEQLELLTGFIYREPSETII